MVGGKWVSLGGVIAAALWGAAAPAVAGPLITDIVPFGDNRGAPTPPVAHYAVGSGRSFVLDRSQGSALLKFEDSAEVWVLEPAPAPRGDVLYRNDLGETVLRATHLGGLTLFSRKDPQGLPVAMTGEAEDLQPPPVMSPGALLQRMIQASARASRAAQHLITFDAPNVTPQSAPVFADAATVAAEAVTRLAQRSDGRGFLARLDKMLFLPGPRPDAAFSGAVMQITIAPGLGLAGRPSSARLMRSAVGR